MSDQTPALPPLASAACAAASWVVALAAAAHTGGPFLAASVVGWTALHVLSATLFVRAKGDVHIGGYPAWSYAASLLHGGVIVPTLFFICLWLLPRDLWHPGAFLPVGWGAGPFTAVLAQIHAAVLAYMLKDFHLCDAVEVGYAVHHVVATLGCATCFLMPMAAGLTTFNAMQSEAASAIFSAYTIWPSKGTFLLYGFSMTASNVGGGYLAYVLCGYDMPLGFRAAYAGAALILVLLRQGAMLLALQQNHNIAAASPGAKGRKAVASPSPPAKASRSPAAKSPTPPPGLGHTPAKRSASPTAASSPADNASPPARPSQYPPGLGYTPKASNGKKRAAKSPARSPAKPSAKSPSRAAAILDDSGLNGKAWGEAPAARRRAAAPRRYAGGD